MNKSAGMGELPEWLLQNAKFVKFQRGQTIFAQNCVLNAIYMVKSGSVLILNINDKGQEAKVVVVPEGGTVGEMEAMVGADNLMYQAKAYSDCVLIMLPVNEFLAWIDQDQRACRQLANLLAHKLYAASRQSAQYASLDAEGRLSTMLAQLPPGLVRYTRQELSETCSCSVRTVSRCIKRLLDQDMIAIVRGKIHTTNLQHQALRERMQSSFKEDVQ